jgi:hypothetical protein
MKYQLVVQFKEDDLSFDDMTALEDSLSTELEDIGDVDGHDFGSGTINFFVLTDDPKSCFAKAKRVVAGKGRGEYKAAFRKISGEEYTILWPKSLKKFHII